MKKNSIILVNVLIVASILAFVVYYARNQSREIVAAKTTSFENMTVAMEQITTNYLEGEQRICDAWAGHINANPMTAEEAAAFVRNAKAVPEAMGHVIFIDDGSMQGFSTDARVIAPDDYNVSYADIAVLDGKDLAGETADSSVNITRAYTNPVNARQSIAFYNEVRLIDAEDGRSRRALLLRVLPLASFERE